MIKYLFIIIIPLLASCTSVELAANLGKKVLFKKNQLKNTNAIYKIGNPYVVDGKRYYPKKNLNYDEKGIASWYGPKFHGKVTANGEIFNQYELTAAHKTLPIPSAVKVTNLKNNKSLIVRINDRGPFVNDRIIDLSYQSAKKLNLLSAGTGFVRVQILRSESIFLEKLAKKNQFPEIADIKKITTPPINQVNYTNVSIKKIGENNLNHNNNLSSKNYKISKNIEEAKNKTEALKINGKKYKIWVQIASFSNRKSANILKTKFNSFKNININKVNINGKTFFRVRVGPFKNIKETKRIYNFLINEGMEGTKIFVE
ncbi:septal ring lytic transglycosylase RlpA family protein [Alphaproteobacteria bacterium]|nr:septal ring lytic transglycosylase RlpA family protein [Alphaproteobacteria bacterium]